MSYPRTITIDNPKLKTLLEKKTELVLEGREISAEIDEKAQQMENIDKAIQEKEKTANIAELDPIIADINKRMEGLMAEMDSVKQEIFKRCKAVVPPNMAIDYEQAKSDKEGLENKRNKVGLKIQKLKDRIIPMVQKEVKPLLTDDFEDLGDVRVENGEVVIDIISHLEAWKEARAKKLKEKYLQT